MQPCHSREYCQREFEQAYLAALLQAQLLLEAGTQTVEWMQHLQD